MSRENMTDGPCSLCGNDGRGERGLFLCESHVALIVKEYEWKLFDDARSALAIAEAKLAKVRERHRGVGGVITDLSYCADDGFVFPCPTYQDTEEQE